MKCLAGLLLFFSVTVLQAQPLIHAHNDYHRPEPFTNAIRNKVFSIEVDIFLVGNKLLVAHDKDEIPTASTLDSFYLQPIIELFRKHKGTITDDTAYAPVLMIDIKENAEPVLAALFKLLAHHPSVFDRSVNRKAVQIVISGDRGPSFKWATYPSNILFDGRPNEPYDDAKLQRIAFISDSWVPYNLPPNDDFERLKQVIDKVHSMKKRIRLWASPDNPESWKLQKELGIDIINTDKVTECRNYFK
ncbi:MAG: glycerophosphodiester phosphodiesterase [Bacteroidetes bacterium]|nr:MAG: glycerophosphodiester phosphodiesterase [Bacteroidota bacterium]